MERNRIMLINDIDYRNKMKVFNSIMVAGLFSMMTVSYASIQCRQLEGSWSGFYRIKQAELCNQYQGCHHLVRMNVSHEQGKQYSVKLQYPVGGFTEELNFECQQGRVTVSGTYEYELQPVCNDTNACFVRFDTSIFYAELMNKY